MPDTSTASERSRPGPAGSGPLLPSNWPAHAADKVEQVVSAVRDKTTGPALVAVRGLVYGLLAAILGITALVLVSIALVRLLDVYIPGNTWKAHVIVGGVFTLSGMFLWRKRRARGEQS